MRCQRAKEQSPGPRRHGAVLRKRRGCAHAGEGTAKLLQGLRGGPERGPGAVALGALQLPWGLVLQVTHSSGRVLLQSTAGYALWERKHRNPISTNVGEGSRQA